MAPDRPPPKNRLAFGAELPTETPSSNRTPTALRRVGLVVALSKDGPFAAEILQSLGVGRDGELN